MSHGAANTTHTLFAVAALLLLHLFVCKVKQGAPEEKEGSRLETTIAICYPTYICPQLPVRMVAINPSRSIPTTWLDHNSDAYNLAVEQKTILRYFLRLRRAKKSSIGEFVTT